MILFIAYSPEIAYIRLIGNPPYPWSPNMTARPSALLMTAFVLAAATLVTVALSPVLQVAAAVVA